MNKFIGVSLAVLLVASLASAILIESPASHMRDSAGVLVAKLIERGFLSAAYVEDYQNDVKILAESKDPRARLTRSRTSLTS